MKHITLTILTILLTASISLSQQLTPPFGLHWGQSQASVKKEVLPRPGTILNTHGTKDGQLMISNVPFGDRNASYISLMFLSDSLCKATLVLSSEDLRNSQLIYDELKEAFTKKYGEPIRDVHSFEQPYFKGDGFEEQAVKLNKSSIICAWDFPNGDVVSMLILKSLSVAIQYENESLLTRLTNKLKEKSSKDY